MVLPQRSTAIQMALLEAGRAVITSPVMPIVDPGALAPLDGIAHIMLSTPRNDNDRWSIGGDETISGTMMLTIMWPLVKPIDDIQLGEIAAVIANHFPADRCLQYGGVRLRCTRRGDDSIRPYVEGAYRVVPVRVFWSTML